MKYAILANDLVRRMSNINMDKINKEEVMGVVENYTRMMVTSGYDRSQAREAIVSGLRGWKAKIRKRKEDGHAFYRSATSTLSMRYKKKLTAETSHPSSFLGAFSHPY